MLFDWWEKKQHQNRNIIAVLFDINGFAAVNQKFGVVTGDKILCQVAQFLQSTSGENSKVGRYSGQQFLGDDVGCKFRAALKNVDFWRQTIEKIVFLREGQPVRIT